MIPEKRAPFTSGEVSKINSFQHATAIFTCNEVSETCAKKTGGQGVLIAYKDCLECPCGKYKQKWVHEFMAVDHPKEKKIPTQNEKVSKPLKERVKRIFTKYSR